MPEPLIDHRARQVAGGRIGHGRVEVGKAVDLAGAQVFPTLQSDERAAVDRHGVFVAQADVDGEIGPHAPVVLNIAAHVIPDLADIARSLETAAAGVAEQERSERVAGVLRSIARHAGGLIGEAKAAVGPVLAVAIPAVMSVEETGLDGVLVADEGDVVGHVEVAAGIAAPEGAAPSAVRREAQLRQAAVGAGDARNLQLFVEFVRTDRR